MVNNVNSGDNLRMTPKPGKRGSLQGTKEKQVLGYS